VRLATILSVALRALLIDGKSARLFLFAGMVYDFPLGGAVDATELEGTRMLSTVLAMLPATTPAPSSLK
jgi:hypothetical protein